MDRSESDSRPSSVSPQQCDQILEHKRSPNVSKSCPTSSHNCFSFINLFSKWTKKSTIIFGTFISKFVANNFQKSPNLVTLRHWHDLKRFTLRHAPHTQCDQMLKQKDAQFFQEWHKSSHKYLSKQPKYLVTKCVCFFSMNICSQDLSKIAKSGHTGTRIKSCQSFYKMVHCDSKQNFD